MIKGSLKQGDLAILSVYAPKNSCKIREATMDRNRQEK